MILSQIIVILSFRCIIFWFFYIIFSFRCIILCFCFIVFGSIYFGSFRNWFNFFSLFFIVVFDLSNFLLRFLWSSCCATIYISFPSNLNPSFFCIFYSIIQISRINFYRLCFRSFCRSCCRCSVSYRGCVTSRRSSCSRSCFRCWSSISCWRFRFWGSWDYSRSWSALSSFCHPTIYRCRLWSRWIRGWCFIRRYCFAITKHSNGAKSNDSNCAIYFIFTNRTVTFCLAIVIEHARSFLHFYN